ncbi:hypothetical protein VTK56DRAFT_7353 [Thermocarpiscus australiensis]
MHVSNMSGTVYHSLALDGYLSLRGFLLLNLEGFPTAPDDEVNGCLVHQSSRILSLLHTSRDQVNLNYVQIVKKLSRSALDDDRHADPTSPSEPAFWLSALLLGF